MSGDPGWGSTSRTVAWSVSVSYRARHCCLATALSMRRRLPCIHGLMMYATVKYSGGHIRKTCRGRTPVSAFAWFGVRPRFSAKPALQIGTDVVHVLEPDGEADEPL